MSLLELTRALISNLSVETEWDGEFYTVTTTIKLEDGYQATAKSRRKMHAVAYTLRDISNQILKDQHD